MVSAAGTNAIGTVGGVVLAACLTPQIYKIWKTRSARDLSYWYLTAYTVGLLLTTLYLYLEKATVGWICFLVETGTTQQGNVNQRQQLELNVVCLRLWRLDRFMHVGASPANLNLLALW